MTNRATKTNCEPDELTIEEHDKLIDRLCAGTIDGLSKHHRALAAEDYRELNADRNRALDGIQARLDKLKMDLKSRSSNSNPGPENS